MLGRADVGRHIVLDLFGEAVEGVHFPNLVRLQPESSRELPDLGLAVGVRHLGFLRCPALLHRE